MVENNDEKIREALEAELVPEEISPENIKKLLDENAPAKKRKNIRKTAVRITAGAAACAVICGVGVHYAGRQNDFSNNSEANCESSESNIAETVNEAGNTEGTAYIKSADDYSQVYAYLKKGAENYAENNTADDILEYAEDDDAYETAYAETADGAYDTAAVTSDENTEYSDTYNQEESVLEADIVKTDGVYIYYLYSKWDDSEQQDKSFINVAETDNGSFADTNVVDISDDAFYVTDDSYVSLDDMYLYNDMLIVIGSVYNYGVWVDDSYGAEAACVDYGTISGFTFVNVYTTGISPTLIASYSQEGSYNDVRITSDGFMYLITDDNTAEFSEIESEDMLEAYIPSYTEGDESCLIEPENIILPDDEPDEFSSLRYLIVGGLDLNTQGEISQADIKAIAGFSGNIYCSGDNLYMASGWNNTTITRFSLSSGIITPEAFGEVNGYVNDQFSMSEYNGYFRIATTFENWEDTQYEEYIVHSREGTDNYVYVLDMDLNQVGYITDFGNDETIKSVNFSGNLAYVVTYEQTDPLFAIDLSNPAEPVILDEYKLLGYSTYMQQWDDGLLLGFGCDADEDGIEIGVKIVMFDNSDPYNLSEAGSYVIDRSNEDEYIYSDAVWERKALLIAPEKNLIGVPIEQSSWDIGTYSSLSSYKFFSYENGEFVYKGEIVLSDNTSDYYYGTSRAVYIGDYVYALNGGKFVSADAETISVIEEVDF